MQIMGMEVTAEKNNATPSPSPGLSPIPSETKHDNPKPDSNVDAAPALDSTKSNSGKNGVTESAGNTVTTAATETTEAMAVNSTLGVEKGANVGVGVGAGAAGGVVSESNNEAPKMVNDDDNHNKKKSPSGPSDGEVKDGVKAQITEKAEGGNNVNDGNQNQQQADNSKGKQKGDSGKSQPPANKKRKLNYIPSKLGRKGDPRMHRALKARLDDPKISLLDALLLGGFEFQWKNGVSYDTDNVQLGQRKNQLSRRLRLHRQNSKIPCLQVKNGLVSVKPSSKKVDNEVSDASKSPQPSLEPSKTKEDDGSNTTPTITGRSSPQNNVANDMNTSIPSMPSLLQHTPQQHQSLLNQEKVRGNPEQLLQYNDEHSLLSSYFSNTMNSSSAMGSGTLSNVAVGTSNNANNSSSISKSDFYQHMNSLDGNTGSGSMHTMNNTLSSNINSSIRSTFTTPTSNVSRSEKLEKLHQALNLYRFDSSALMKRCMLSAGFSHQETEECDEMYLLFGELALENEKKRLDRIKFRMNRRPLMSSDMTHDMASGKPAHCHHLHTDTVASSGGSGTNSNALKANDMSAQNSMNVQQPLGANSFYSGDSATSQKKGNNMRLQSLMNGQTTPNPNRMYFDSTNNKISSQVQQEPNSQHSHSHNHGSSQSCNNLHLHRLEGKCGHKAIIHKPADGNAHIDFVVDGKVECYENCQPMIDSTAFWLSKFKGDKKHGSSVSFSSVFDNL